MRDGGEREANLGIVVGYAEEEGDAVNDLFALCERVVQFLEKQRDDLDGGNEFIGPRCYYVLGAGGAPSQT